MKSYEEFYIESLYPLQNGIIQLIRSLNTPFYLTGGTALSRVYFDHRYSDDLDFFTNNQTNFIELVAIVTKAIDNYCGEKGIEYVKSKTIISDSFAQMYINKNGTLLKIDFVNDISAHFGEIIQSPEFGLVDSIRNILSNKITALSRFEPKDIVDIWIIAKRHDFTWDAIFDEAKEKEIGVDVLIAAEIIQSFPQEKLNFIKWVQQYSPTQIKSDLEIIVQDMLAISSNSLFNK